MTTTTTNKMTKQELLLAALQTGATPTAAQITEQFGLRNPTAAVSTLRFSGYAVYANQRANAATTYRLGRPSRAVVAAGYRALAEQTAV